MVNGEELAGAFVQDTRTREADVAAKFGASLGAAGQQLRGQNQLGGRSPSITTVLAAATAADEHVGQRVKMAFMLAERMEAIAQRLAGPYPQQSAAGVTQEAERERTSDPSAFAAMQAAFERISARAVSADPALARLTAALAQIERLLT